jgi:hypothetical protein
MGRFVAKTSRELAELRKRVEDWRATRERQGPMPEALWVAAALAAKKFGVTRVAEELTVGHAGLKRRMDGVRKRPARRAAERSSGFVQVTGAQLLAAQPAAGAFIEYAGRDGTRVAVTLPAESNVDVPALVAALRGS